MIGWAILGGVLGAVGGSFSATYALRTLDGRQAVLGGSVCDGCSRPLGFEQTVPVLSYLVLGGRCQACGGAISKVHLLGEWAGMAAGAASLVLLPPIQGLLALTLTLVMLASAIIDHHSQRLPDRATLVIAGLAAVLGALAGRLIAGLVAAVLVAALLLAVRALFQRRKGDPGLGLGDVKLLAALALWLGAATPWAVVIAAGIGLAVHRHQRPEDGRIAFGPAIGISAVVVGLAVDQTVFPGFPGALL